MNVLLVSSKYMPEYSGSGFRAHNLYKRLTKKINNLNVTVFSSSTEFNENINYQYDGFPVYRIACKKYLSPSTGISAITKNSINFNSERNATLKALNNLKEKIDLIHIFGKSYVTATVLDYARKKNIPVIIELCNEMDTPFQFVPFLNRFQISTKLPKKYTFICISEMLKQMAITNNIPPENIWCRPNPINEKLFFSVSEDQKYKLRRQLSKFEKNDILITYIAKFRPSKNHRLLIEVLEQLPDNFKLLVGGPLVNCGPDKQIHNENVQNLKNMIKEKNLSKRVELMVGFIDNMNEFYQMSDIFAFPTLNEALGTPMLEAIASGIPVVATDLKNVTDVWIKNGINGYLASPTIDNFVDKIKKSVKIERDVLMKASSDLLSCASTKVIDEEYMKIFSQVSK